MKISEMIEQLQSLYDKFGDLEVEISDDFDEVFYSGDFSIIEWQKNDAGELVVDIGVGGAKQEY